MISFGTHTWKFSPDYLFGGVDNVISEVIKAFCCVAVNVYVLISGYFGIKLKFRKLIKIELMTLFYSLSILVILLWMGGVSFHRSLAFLLPVTSIKYWFITVYIVLCLLSPILNNVCDNMSKNMFHPFIIGAVLVVYVWASVAYIFNFKQFVPDYGGGIVSFSVLYMTGRYIRIYLINHRSWVFYMGCFMVSTITLILCDLAFSQVLGFQFTLTNNNSIFMYVNAIFLFLAFREMKLKSQFINMLAVDCLAVYIIHMNPVGIAIINNVFNLEGTTGLMIAVKALCVPFVVYIICIGIEKLRKELLGGVENCIADKIVYCGKWCWFKFSGLVR